MEIFNLFFKKFFFKFLLVAIISITSIFYLSTLHIVNASSAASVWEWIPGTTSELVDGLSNILTVSSGSNHKLALKDDGTVWAWGNNSSGQLGNGTLNDNSSPVQVVNVTGEGHLTGVKAISANSDYSMALKNDGTVWIWGDSLQLFGSTPNSVNTKPVQVMEKPNIPLDNIVAIAAGDRFALALKADGTVYEWGGNNDRHFLQVCSSESECSEANYPIQIKDSDGENYLTGVKAIASGYSYNLVVKNDGTVWGWGYTLQDQLGANNKDTDYKVFPVKIDGLSDIKSVSSKYFYNLALDKDGYVYEWGDYYFSNFQKRPNLQNIVEISAGYNGGGQGFAIDATGKALHWQVRAMNSVPDVINTQSTVIAIAAQYGNNIPYLYVTSGSSITPTPSAGISLQDYKQNRNADGSSVPWATQQLYNLSSCPTMASDGCAITAFADVLASYKLANLPNGTSVDPGNLNNYFAQTPGTHSGCSIYFNTAGTSVNYTVLHNDFSWIPLQTRIQHIDEALNNGNLVIAGVGGHFIVLDKKADLPAADGSPDYYIADPYRYAPYATGDRTGKLLSQTYKSVDQLEGVLQVVVLANKAPSPGKSWVIVAHSPVKFLVTDPEGNQTGYDPNSNTNIQNIPDSSYGIQQGLIDDTGVQPPQPDILYYGQENPVPGEYKIEVVGTGKGEYKLDLGEATGPGQTSLQTVTGTAAIGKTDTYIVTAPSDESTSPTFTKEVTFDVLNADLKSLYDRGLIDNKGIYTSFSVEVDAAAKANKIQINLLRKPLTLAALKAFLDELKAQRGKHVKEDAYQILYNDVQSLIKNLQGGSGSPTPTPVSGGS